MDADPFPGAGRFLGAARTVAALVGDLPPDGWAGPGLGAWDLRALVGHASRSLVTVRTYLEQPAPSEAVPTAARYYVFVLGAVADEAAVVERGRQAGIALGDDPPRAFQDLVDGVRQDLAGHHPDYLLTTLAGGMRLSEYLRTRVFELVIHGMDIARATGRTVQFDHDALREVLALSGEIAVETGRGADLALALTGRTTLPRGFSVV